MPTDITSLAQIDWLIGRAIEAANKTREEIRTLLDTEAEGLAVLRAFKFSKQLGRHPFRHHSLNLIEQINQTWTSLVTLYAVQFLFTQHEDAGGFRVCFGTEAGTDIISLAPADAASPRMVAAEAYAAVHPRRNNKLQNDYLKLMREHPNALWRYIFYGGPKIRNGPLARLGRRLNGVEVWGIKVDM
jgi:hypothetical protein